MEIRMSSRTSYMNNCTALLLVSVVCITHLVRSVDDRLHVCRRHFASFENTSLHSKKQIYQLTGSMTGFLRLYSWLGDTWLLCKPLIGWSGWWFTRSPRSFGLQTWLSVNRLLASVLSALPTIQFYVPWDDYFGSSLRIANQLINAAFVI